MLRDSEGDSDDYWDGERRGGVEIGVLGVIETQVNALLRHEGFSALFRHPKPPVSVSHHMSARLVPQAWPHGRRTRSSDAFGTVSLPLSSLACPSLSSLAVTAFGTVSGIRAGVDFGASRDRKSVV